MGRRDDQPLFDAGELQTALQAGGVGLWAWDLRTDRIRWSADTAALFGLPAVEFEGSISDFTGRVHPDDLAAVETINTVCRAGTKDQLEERLRPHPESGGVGWVHVRGRVVRGSDGKPTRVLGVVLDVTAEQAASERLRDGEARYRLFTELASDYVYEVHPGDGGLAPSVVAGSFERTTGYTTAEVADAGGWLAVMHPGDQEAGRQVLARLHQGEPIVHEYRILAKEGGVRWLRDRIHPVTDPETGELQHLAGGVQDITERKQLQEQLAHAQKLEALARLAGSVAHDFNNLLTVMMGATELIALEQPTSPADDTATHGALADLQLAEQRAAELTASLLAFARRKPGVRRRVTADEALDGARALLERGVGERVQLRMTAGAGDAAIAIDRGQFEMALLNLAINARDAMPDGGTLDIASTTTHFAPGDTQRPPELSEGEHVLFVLTDSGTGIPEEALPQIFEPFFSTKESKGTGLGLSTVHGIVHQFGGAIVAGAGPGGGAQFSLYLPLADGEIDAPDVPSNRPASGGQESIVLVDDEPGVLRTMCNALSGLGYRVTAFARAEDALADPAALERCDLLLSDVRLPGIAGTELAERCCARRPGLRVLLTSGYVEEAAQAALIESGRFPFLAKPFGPGSLAQRVRETLDAGRTG